MASLIGFLKKLPEGEDFGFKSFISSIDVIAQGSRTFLQTISFIESDIVPDLPYDGKHMYVFTRKPLDTNRTDVTFVSSIEEYINTIKKNPNIKRVWLLSGAEIIASFKEHDLIDECIITIIPKILHEGIALPSNLFNGMRKISSKNYSQRIVEKTYARTTN